MLRTNTNTGILDPNYIYIIPLAIIMVITCIINMCKYVYNAEEKEPKYIPDVESGKSTAVNISSDLYMRY